MGLMNWFAVALLAVAVFVVPTRSVHDSYNFELKPMKRECFFEDFDKNTPVKTIEAFIQSGGNLVVLLTIHGPLDLADVRSGAFEDPMVSQRVDAAMESDSETQTFTMSFKPDEAGTYAVCLDNRMGRFLSKVVQLDVRTAKRAEPIALKLGGEQKGTTETTAEEEGVVRAKETLARIKKGLKKIQVQQQRDRHRLKLHSETNVVAHNRVVSGSIVETAFFIAAALFQIFFVRRWFSSRSTEKPGV